MTLAAKRKPRCRRPAAAIGTMRVRSGRPAAGPGVGEPAGRVPGAAAQPASEPGAAAPAGDDALRYPLSFSQRSIWLLDRLVPGGNPAYVIAGAARVRGGVDAARLYAALREV